MQYKFKSWIYTSSTCCNNVVVSELNAILLPSELRIWQVVNVGVLLVVDEAVAELPTLCNITSKI